MPTIQAGQEQDDVLTGSLNGGPGGELVGDRLTLRPGVAVIESEDGA